MACIGGGALKTAVIYVRVSTEDQAEHGFSLEGQKDECYKKARELGVEKAEVFADEGISGSILDRPALVAAIDKLKREKINFFICLDTSRLSRNLRHTLFLVNDIRECGAEAVFIKDSFEDNPEGDLQMSLFGAINQYERAKIRSRTLDGKKQKAKAGKLTHSPGIYGYAFDKETDTLSLIEEQAEYIRMMYRWFVEEQKGPYAIADRLNAMGVPSPKGKLWSKQTVGRILANLSYTGTMYIGRYDTTNVKLNKYHRPEARVKRKERPSDEWVPISIPVVIDKELWSEAKRRLENIARVAHSHSSHPYLLSGLVRCGLCGSTLHGNRSSSRGVKRAYYVCTAKSPGIRNREKCRLKVINADTVDEVIWNHVSAWLLDPEHLNRELSEAFTDAEAAGQAEELRVIEQQLKSGLVERNRVVTMFQKGFIQEEELEQRVKDVDSRSAFLGSRRRQLEDEQKRRRLVEQELRTMSQLAQTVSSNMDKLRFDERQHIVRLLVDEVVYDGTGLSVGVRIPDNLLSSVAGGQSGAAAASTCIGGGHRPPHR